MMNYPYNLHTHTVFCDGGNTAEEMARAGFEAGLKTLGFSGHSVMPKYEDWCMNAYTQSEYIKSVKKLKKEYEGRMEIALGLELDFTSDYSDKMLSLFEYIIGSVHSVLAPNGKSYYVDASEAETIECIKAFGNARSFAEEYYKTLILNARKSSTDILGHFDLLLKYNEKAKFIDEKSDWYRELSLSAAEEIAKTGVTVEVNTGAISRKARSIPYPTAEVIKLFNEKGTPLILSSDTHSVHTVNYYFSETLEMLRSLGVKSLAAFENGRFIQVGI